jgi:LysM repeat protein
MVIGSLMLIQGCGTTQPEAVSVPSETVMPPAVVEQPVAATNIPAKFPEPVKIEEKVYIVKKGDTLGYIAKRFNVSVKDIIDVNKVKNPNVIHAGQRLNLPEYVDLNAPEPKWKPRAVKKAAGVKVKRQPMPASGEYIVKNGDMLSSIAVRYGTTVKALMTANNLTSDRLQIGQKLVLSGGAAVEAGAPAEVAPTAAEPAPLSPAAPGEEAAKPSGSSAIIHVVEPGQELSAIAMMYSVHLEELMKLNGLTNSAVKVGQALKIPPPAE